MSWAYCPPKSRTRIKLLAHPDALGRLLGLALGRERGSEHDLGLLELFYVLVAGRSHAGPQGAHEVERPVVLAGWPDEYLLERTRGPCANAGAAREGRVESRHPPRVAAARGLLGPGEGAAEHHGVGAAGNGLGDLTARAHPTVGDDVDVLPGLQVVAHAGRGGVGDGGSLRHADPDHTARRADAPRPDADEDAYGPRAHEVKRRGVARAAAHDYGDVQRRHELHQVQGLDRSRDVLRGDHRPLDYQHVEAGLDGGPVIALDPLGRERGRRYDALVLYLLHATEDELFLDRLGVDVLHDPGRLVLGQAGYLFEDGTWVLVPRL